MASVITQTRRLYLRPFVAEDAFHLYEMNKDAEVLRYTRDRPFPSPEAAGEFIRNYNEYATYGMGRWAVLRKEDEVFLGWCGLKYHPLENIVEVGYRFHKKFWGYGYATESAEAALEYGFSQLKLPRIYAHIKPGNKASEKVLAKCGLHFVKSMVYDGISVALYAKDSPYIEVQTVTATETYPVRHAVLRQGKPLSACALEGDDLPSALHLGAFFKGRIIGVVTFLENTHDLFPYARQVQLRGMGVLPEFQKKGIGELLVSTGEQQLVKRGIPFIWMNARVVALSFYRKLGYIVFGAPFTISDIGLHYKMTKPIAPQKEEAP